MSGVGLVAASAAGASLVNLALAPLFAANQYIGSYFFGSGMILGERDMYQEDWPKIKARLDKGESFAAILEEQTVRNTTAIMANAQDIVIQVSSQWNKIVFDYLAALPKSMLDLLGIGPPKEGDCPPGFKWDPVQGRCRPTSTEKPPPPKGEIPCPSGFHWSSVAQQCVPDKKPPTKYTFDTHPKIFINPTFWPWIPKLERIALNAQKTGKNQIIRAGVFRGRTSGERHKQWTLFIVFLDQQIRIGLGLLVP